MNKFRLLEKMETVSSPQLTEPKTQKNKPTVRSKELIMNHKITLWNCLDQLQSKMSNKIIQWNCRGIRAKYEELFLFLNKYNPKVVCLQETFLKDKNQLNIKHFHLHNHHYKDGDRASEDVPILVRKDIPNSKSTLTVNSKWLLPKLHFTNW